MIHELAKLERLHLILCYFKIGCAEQKMDNRLMRTQESNFEIDPLYHLQKC